MTTSAPTSAFTPAAFAAFQKRGAPERPFVSTSAIAGRSSAAARSTRSSGSDDPFRNENAEATRSSAYGLARFAGTGGRSNARRRAFSLRAPGDVYAPGRPGLTIGPSMSRPGGPPCFPLPRPSMGRGR